LVAAVGAWFEGGRQTGDLPARKEKGKRKLRDGGAGAEAAEEATSRGGLCLCSLAPSGERGRWVGSLGVMAPGEGRVGRNPRI